MEDYDERALAERATAWLGNDAEELADLIEDIQEMFEDAIEHDEGSEDVRTACAELLARDGLTTLDRAQLGIWRAFMAIAGADADAIEHCRDARDWVNDLEIVAAKSGLSDPRLEQLRNDAEELRDQLPEETTLKPDPTIVRVEALLAAQRATRDQKTATTAAKGETNQTLMPSVLARVQVYRSASCPETRSHEPTLVLR